MLYALADKAKIVVFEKFQVHKKTIIYGSYDAEGVEGEHSILHIFMISIVCYNQMQRLLLAAWSNPFFSPADEYDPLAWRWMYFVLAAESPNAY